MKQYPSIPSGNSMPPSGQFYGFDKLDGSNIRASWTRKHKAFNKFGSRTVLLDHTHPTLGTAPELIKTKYEQILTDIFLAERYEEVTCFFEFWGLSSFAGNHEPTDVHTVTLFDINVYKQGMIGPAEFLKLFKDKVEIPTLLHHGNITSDLIENVKNSNVLDMTFEGMVLKGLPIKNGYPPHMVKLKSSVWLQKLKTFCNGNEKLEEQLK